MRLQYQLATNKKNIQKKVENIGPVLTDNRVNSKNNQKNKVIQRMLKVDGKLISSGMIINMSQRPKEFKEAISGLEMGERFKIQDQIRSMALDKENHQFSSWEELIGDLQRVNHIPNGKDVIDYSSDDESVASSSSGVVKVASKRTGHTSSAHLGSVHKSQSRAEKKNIEYNGRWYDAAVMNRYVSAFYALLAERKLGKGNYFVKCKIPLRDGHAVDQDGKQHECDGFFIKMTSMGSSKSKWKYSTCHPRMQNTMGGNVVMIDLK